MHHLLPSALGPHPPPLPTPATVLAFQGETSYNHSSELCSAPQNQILKSSPPGNRMRLYLDIRPFLKG